MDEALTREQGREAGVFRDGNPAPHPLRRPLGITL